MCELKEMGGRWKFVKKKIRKIYYFIQSSQKKTPVLSLLNGLVKWNSNRLNNVTPFTQLGNERTVMGPQLPMVSWVLGIRRGKHHFFQYRLIKYAFVRTWKKFLIFLVSFSDRASNGFNSIGIDPQKRIVRK